MALVGTVAAGMILLHKALIKTEQRMVPEPGVMTVPLPVRVAAPNSPTTLAPPPLPTASVWESSPSREGLVVPVGYILLQYDVAQSFDANLKRLREHCDAWPEITEHPGILSAFVSELMRHARGQYAAVENALKAPDGTNGYRCILLACLMSCDGPEQASADWVWKMAVNTQEWSGVRRTAAFLASRVTDSTTRPDQLWALLTDADSQVVVSALAVAWRHMDRRVYEYISTELAGAEDIHVRVAAIKVLGTAPYEHEGQVKLKELIGAIETSSWNPLSEASLAKRTAIQNLDMEDPASWDLLQRIASDPDEDPGVRAKAIGRFPLKDHPAAESWLTSLLDREIDNPLVARAVVEVLMSRPTAQRSAFIREHLNRMADPQMRTVIQSRMEMAQKWSEKE